MTVRERALLVALVQWAWRVTYSLDDLTRTEKDELMEHLQTALTQAGADIPDM